MNCSMINSIKLEDDILLNVKKPGRYIGNEFNVVKKDLSEVDLKFALCFPDLYEIGMSYLGIKILYGILNALDYVACERVFAPDLDMEKVLRERGLPLFSLESKLPLADFDIIGFSIGYEMTYTNILNMLNLANIPLRTRDRGDGFGIVIAGGPCSFNPEPMSDFIDAFVIGDGEDVVIEIVEIVRRYKEKKTKRKEILFELSKIEGVYVPSFYDVEYFRDGRIKDFKPVINDIPSSIKKRIMPDLDKAYYPTKQIVPFIEVIHDRISLELMRGCGNGCRFCQANVLYGPRRLRSKAEVLRLAHETLRHTGYDEISLMSLSTLDHPEIIEIVSILIDDFKDKGISIALPSLKVTPALLEVLPLITRVSKTGLTFAPEAGSQRLRKFINKDIDIEILLDSIKKAFELGYRKIKLYFMIGFPTETTEDLDGIVEFVHNILDLNKGAQRSIGINVSISNFVPKPHTPFQHYAMCNREELMTKQSYLKKYLRNKCIRVRFHDINLSLLEALFARGDRHLSQILYCAYIKGAKFDSWKDYFRFDIWHEVFDKLDIDIDTYLSKKESDEKLPWGHIDAHAKCF